MTLVGTKEIAAMLACTQAHVTDRIVRMPGFPAPKVALSRKTRRWDMAEVLRFVEARSARQ